MSAGDLLLGLLLAVAVILALRAWVRK